MQVSAPWATCHLIRSFTFWTSWERYTTDLLSSGLAMPSQRNMFIPSHYVVRTWFVFASPFCYSVRKMFTPFFIFLFFRHKFSLRIDVFICQHLQINLIGTVQTPLSAQWAFLSQHNSPLSLNKWTLIHLNGVESRAPCCLREILDRDFSCFSWSRRTSGVSHNAFYWSSGCFYIFTWLAVFHTANLKRNAITVVYPKKRLTLQHSKHSWFSHTGWKPVRVVLSPLLWCRTLSPDGRIISFTVKSGVVLPVLTAHPALDPTGSKRPAFSQAVEHSSNGLIASRLKEMDIGMM